MKVNPLILLLFLWIPSIQPVNALDGKVESRINKDSVSIGETLEVSIIISSEVRLKSIFLLDKGLFQLPMEMLNSTADSTFSREENTYTFHYEGIAFDTGTFRINPAMVLLSSGTGKDTLFSQEFYVHVYYPPVDTASAIKDIKGPVNTPLTLAELKTELALGSGILLLLLAAFLIYRYLHRRSAGEIKREPELPAHVKAINSLNRLKKEKIWQEGRIKDYYSELSDIIRNYLEERYGFPAMESVTQEIIESFRPWSYEDDFLMEVLEKLLITSDLVKFAKEDPGPMENETNLNNAYIFVEKTKESEKVEDISVSHEKAEV